MARLFLVALWLLFAASSFAQSAEQKSLTIAISNNNAPFHFIDQNGQADGLAVDIWRLWSKKTNTPIRFIGSDWPTTLTNVETGAADVHVALVPLPERQAQFAFGAAIFDVSLSVYLHKNIIAVERIGDLTPIVVGVIKNSAQRAVLLKANPDIAIREFSSRSALISAVSKEQIHAFVEFDFFAMQLSEYKAIAEAYPVGKRLALGTNSTFVATTKKNQNRLAEFDQGFGLISREEREQLERKWLGIKSSSPALNVSFSVDHAPYMQVDANGRASGLFIDFWQLWSEKVNVPIKFVPNTMTHSVDDVVQGVTDFHVGVPLLDGVADSLQSVGHIYSVTSYLYLSQGLNLSSLNAKNQALTIGLLATAPYKDQFMASYPAVRIQYFDDLEKQLAAAANQEIDGFVGGEQLTHRRLVQMGLTKRFSKVDQIRYELEIHALARSNGNHLASKIAEGLDLMTISELSSLERKWLDQGASSFYRKARFQTELSRDQQQWLKANPTISVGVTNDWQPFEFTDSSGKVVGINVDMLNIISNLTGQLFDYKVYESWPDLVDDFKVGKLDMVANMGKSDARRQYTLFSEPFWSSAWAVITHKSEKSYNAISQLTGKRIAVVHGYSIGEKVMFDYPQLIVVSAPDLESATQLLADGEVDAVLENLIVAAQHIRNNDHHQFNVHVLSDLEKDLSHIGINKDMPLQAQIIDKALATIQEDEKRRILNHWFKLDLVSGISYSLYWRNIGLAVLVSALIVLFFWRANRKLRREIALRHEAEQKLIYLASHDTLTGLPNRALFNDRLKQALASHERHKRQLYVLFIDLDGFKAVNDQYGHDMGDKLLIGVSHRLEGLLRRSDTVARLGGDEFCILLPEQASPKQVAILTAKIIAEVGRPFVLDGIELHLGASIGISGYPSDGDNNDDLLKVADDLMYQAKREGKNRFIMSPSIPD